MTHTEVLAQGSTVKFTADFWQAKIKGAEWQWYNTSNDGQIAYFRKLGANGAPLSPHAKTMHNCQVSDLKQAANMGALFVTVGTIS